MIYHYFLLQDKTCNFWRLGIEGSKEAAQDYFSQYFKVEYIDEYPMLIHGDIDEWQGVGCRQHKIDSGEFTVRTFKHIHTMMSQSKPYDWFSAIKNTHAKIKASMEFQLKEEERKTKRRDNHRSTSSITR